MRLLLSLKLHLALSGGKGLLGHKKVFVSFQTDLEILFKTGLSSSSIISNLSLSKCFN